MPEESGFGWPPACRPNSCVMGGSTRGALSGFKRVRQSRLEAAAEQPGFEARGGCLDGEIAGLSGRDRQQQGQGADTEPGQDRRLPEGSFGNDSPDQRQHDEQRGSVIKVQTVGDPSQATGGPAL